jgi:hypothetical protein
MTSRLTDLRPLRLKSEAAALSIVGGMYGPIGVPASDESPTDTLRIRDDQTVGGAIVALRSLLDQTSGLICLLATQADADFATRQSAEAAQGLIGQAIGLLGVVKEGVLQGVVQEGGAQ